MLPGRPHDDVRGTGAPPGSARRGGLREMVAQGPNQDPDRIRLTGRLLHPSCQADGMALREPFRPTKSELEAAREREIPDVLARGLDVVFVGINPGLWSGAAGHHFARPGNRFWTALEASGFTQRVLSPFEDRSLLDLGLGVTNLVRRTTASADELTDEEIRQGGRDLRQRLEPLAPRAVAILGIGAYRVAFDRSRAPLGRQDEGIASADTWVLPNPSGVNAHYQVPELAGLFAEVRRAVGRADARRA
jgi:double-stranded uracil-DNA glycosylase